MKNIKSLFPCLVMMFVSATQTFAQGGIPLWTNLYNGELGGGSTAYAIAVDRSDNIFVTGAEDTLGNPYYTTVAYSNAGIPLWTNRYARGFGSDYAAMAVGKNGNVFVTGTAPGSADNSDYGTIAYSNSGIPLWTNLYNGGASSGDYPFAIAVDSSGDVFVTGGSTGSGISEDYATIKYSSAGVPLWTRRYNGPVNRHDEPVAIAVDSSGNVFVTGASASGTGSPDNYDYATIKYSSAGVPLWTKRYNGPANGEDFASAMAVDSSGNVFVTGYSDGSAGNPDYATIKYSSAGVALWTNRYDGPANGYDYAYAIAVDSSGNVLVTGRSSANNTFPFNDDIVTVAYSNSGIPLWTNRYDGPAGEDDWGRAIAVDGSGNVFVTGSSRYYDGVRYYYYFVTIAYSNAGEALWTNRYDGPGGSASAIAVDSNGNVFVTGSASYDYVTIKYSSSLPPHLSIARDGSNGLFIRHNGAPDFTYRLQRATSVTGPWSDVATNTAPASGLVEYHEISPPPTQAFYRTVQP
ncbi:MAG: SBBP repeat-containing protein [Verrucomicrobia bacterium]|nr:SBBP repeat-containing protein [Verrucomicrobiota bacterium]